MRELRAEGALEEALQGAALLAQDEIDRLKAIDYQEHEARAVALPMFILHPPEPEEDDEQAHELAANKRRYHENVAPFLTWQDDHEDLPIR